MAQASHKATFLEIDRDNVIELAHLRVRKSEKHLIGANAIWIAQANYVEESQTYGIYSDGSPAGLVSMINPRLYQGDLQESHLQDECLYVWRLMIDRKHRGKGLGKSAIDFAIKLATDEGLRGVSLTTMDQAPKNALEFYTRLKFEPTGRRLDGEIELILLH